MTTGVDGVPLLTGFTNQVGFSPAYYRTWSGVDGKTELIGDFVREKWNDYTATIFARTALYRSFTLLVGDPGSHTPNGEEIEYFPSWGTLTPSGYTITANEQNKLLSKILKKIKGHEFNLAVSLGQLHETVGMLAGNLSKLGRAMMSLKHGDFANAARCLGAQPRYSKLKARDIAGRWLELQYGWRPLVSDSYEAMLAFHEISRGPRKKIFKAGISKPMSHEHSGSPSHYSAICRGALSRQIQYEMYEEMSIERQLGVLNPLSVAWELVPYSFVVDWFLPFGSYLDNLGQIPHLLGRWLITDRWKYDKPPEIAFNESILPTYIDGYWVVRVKRNLSMSERLTKVVRVFSEAPPIVPMPKLQWGISSSRRFWNAVSLASQRFLVGDTMEYHPDYSPTPDRGFYDPTTGYSE